MPCPGPFHFSYSVDYIYDFCPLPDTDVGLSIFVCDVEHTSFHVGMCGRKFVFLRPHKEISLAEIISENTFANQDIAHDVGLEVKHILQCALDSMY